MFNEKKRLREDVTNLREATNRLLRVNQETADENAQLMKQREELLMHLGIPCHLNPDVVLTRARIMRAKADCLDNIMAVVRNEFNADAALLRRLACSLGTSQLDEENVKRRAVDLGKVNAANVRLRDQLAVADVKVRQLQDDLYEYHGIDEM